MAADTGFTPLNSERLSLRRFDLSDLDAFVSYRSDSETAKYQSWSAPYPTADAARLIGEMQTTHPDEPGEWFQFAIELHAQHGLIGDCAACPLADGTGTVEIGYTIAPAFRGHGYAVEAVARLLDYVFVERGKHRVIAFCDVRNGSSSAVAERLGMRREGLLRESAPWQDGWADEYLYAILDREWSRRPTR